MSGARSSATTSAPTGSPCSTGRAESARARSSARASCGGSATRRARTSPRSALRGCCRSTSPHGASTIRSRRLKDAVAGPPVGARAGCEEPPEESLARVLGAWPARVEGPLLLVLDQFEELFVYHDRRGDSGARGARSGAARPRPRRPLPALAPRGLAREARPLQGPRSGSARPPAADRPPRPRRRACEAIVEPLERWNETVGGGRRGGRGRAGARRGRARPGADRQGRARRRWRADRSRRYSGRRHRGAVPPARARPALGRGAPRRDSRSCSACRRSSGSAAPTGSSRTHLDAALAALPAARPDVAGRRFRYLVTPSGTKIAHRVGRPRGPTPALPEERLEPLVEQLAGDVRILRRAGDGRYEIYHDALAGPILDWTARWESAREAQARAATAGDRRRDRARARRNRAGDRDPRDPGAAGPGVGSSRAITGAGGPGDRDPGRRTRRRSRPAVRSADVSPTTESDSALRATLASDFLLETLRVGRRCHVGRLQPGREVHRHDEQRRDRPAVGRGDGSHPPRPGRPPLPYRKGGVQPRRESAPRHGRRRTPSLADRDRSEPSHSLAAPKPEEPSSSHRACPARRLQPGRKARRERRLGREGADLGRRQRDAACTSFAAASATSRPTSSPPARAASTT